MKKIIFASIIGLSSLFLSLYVSAASEMEQFKQVYGQYNKKIAAGHVKGALPLAEQAYKLGSNIFDPDSANLMALADNYAFVLVALGDVAKADSVYQEVIAANEEFYGNYSQTLIPVLESAAKVVSKSDAEKSKAYAIRALKLKMRHNSLEMSQKIDEGKLSQAKDVKKIAKDAAKISGKKFKVFEGEHWSIAYEVGYEEGVSILNDQLEAAYKSIRSFMLAVQFAQRPLNGKKLAALMFGTEEGYLTYIEKKDMSRRSKGSFFEKEEVLVIFDRIHKRSNWEYYKRSNIVAQEAFQQVAVHSGMLSKVRTLYPLWFWDGLANTFEFNDIEQEFGPQTNNLSSRNWEIAQELIDDGEWLTLDKFISLSKVDDNNKDNKRVLYYMGTFLVRFLYTHHADEFLNYISIMNKGSNDLQTGRERSRAFTQAFGDPEKLEKKWRRFMQGYGITFNEF